MIQNIINDLRNRIRDSGKTTDSVCAKIDLENKDVFFIEFEDNMLTRVSVYGTEPIDKVSSALSEFCKNPINGLCCGVPVDRLIGIMNKENKDLSNYTIVCLD